jgi:hypothetical protein
MAEVPRISADEAHREVASGKALLVCAYDDDDKCNKIKLEGAISLKDLQARVPSLPKDTRLIFYCA